MGLLDFLRGIRGDEEDDDDAFRPDRPDPDKDASDQEWERERASNGDLIFPTPR